LERDLRRAKGQPPLSLTTENAPINAFRLDFAAAASPHPFLSAPVNLRIAGDTGIEMNGMSPSALAATFEAANKPAPITTPITPIAFSQSLPPFGLPTGLDPFSGIQPVSAANSGNFTTGSTFPGSVQPVNRAPSPALRTTSSVSAGISPPFPKASFGLPQGSSAAPIDLDSFLASFVPPESQSAVSLAAPIAPLEDTTTQMEIGGFNNMGFPSSKLFYGYGS